jgi:hypothetical protein
MAQMYRRCKPIESDETKGYEMVDFNLDGGTSGDDTIYQLNQGEQTLVPQEGANHRCWGGNICYLISEGAYPFDILFCFKVKKKLLNLAV